MPPEKLNFHLPRNFHSMYVWLSACNQTDYFNSFPRSCFPHAPIVHWTLRECMRFAFVINTKAPIIMLTYVQLRKVYSLVERVVFGPFFSSWSIVCVHRIVFRQHVRNQWNTVDVDLYTTESIKILRAGNRNEDINISVIEISKWNVSICCFFFYFWPNGNQCTISFHGASHAH